ncbi:MAG: lysophospholipid acyltransferase family protein [Pseudomonadota bacterium]
MLRASLIVVLRPLLWLLFGLSVGGREHLPRQGPAIVAANHNSHVDILFLLCAFPLRAGRKVVPMGAADYFLATPLLRFVALRILGLLPLERRVRRGADPLEGSRRALEEGRILIVFPEGTRGQPEEMGELKSGLTKLARDASAPIIPVYLQGAGRILPKGARLPVPFLCTMLVAPPIHPQRDRAAMMADLSNAYGALREAAPPLHWS